MEEHLLNNGTDISHRLVMVKYPTDKCRVKNTFLRRKGYEFI